jgi:hypothetical protein
MYQDFSDTLSWLRLIFLSPSRQMSGQYFKSDNECFLTYPFQFIIHWSSTIQHYVVWDKKKLRGFGPLANYADRATAASWRSSTNFLRLESVAWSAQHSPGRILGFLDWSRCYFFQVAPQLYSRVLTRLSTLNKSPIK